VKARDTFSAQCWACQHYDLLTSLGIRHCTAFPAGGPEIPAAIWDDHAAHDTVLPTQTGEDIFDVRPALAAEYAAAKEQ
jgi:hypothetical protein